MKWTFRLMALTSLCSSLCGAGGKEADRYYGEDITRPLNRFDVKVKGDRGFNCRVSRDIIATARTDLLLNLPEGWQVGIRMDMPYAWYWANSLAPACGADVDHWDDSLLQVICIAPPQRKWTIAAGIKLIFPTAADHLQIGDGKFQFLPSMGIKYDLGDWREGAYAGLIVRQAFSAAGYRSAHSIHKTFIQPFFNVNLADPWFLNFSPQLIYNWRIKKWFIPFDVMLGTMVQPDVVVSLEYQTALVYQYKQFTQSLECRIGYFY